MQKHRLLFFGSSNFVIPIIEVLKKNFDLCLVITTEENPTDPVPSYCTNHKIPYLSVQQLNNSTIQQLKKCNASVGVLADFGLIISKEILNAFPKGIINIHPSLLPKYRGPTPVQTAILNGEKETGVSIIKLDNEIDHGPILRQEKEKITPLDTAQSLYERLFKKGGEMLPNIINAYLNGKIKLTAQNHKSATFTKRLTRQDGHVNMSKVKSQKSKAELDRMIRAYFPWPAVWTKTKINGKVRIIKFLPDQKIQVEGKKPMSYKDFINGYPNLSPVMLNLFQHLKEN